MVKTTILDYQGPYIVFRHKKPSEPEASPKTDDMKQKGPSQKDGTLPDPGPTLRTQTLVSEKRYVN